MDSPRAEEEEAVATVMWQSVEAVAVLRASLLLHVNKAVLVARQQAHTATHTITEDQQGASQEASDRPQLCQTRRGTRTHWKASAWITDYTGQITQDSIVTRNDVITGRPRVCAVSEVRGQRVNLVEPMV